MMNQLIAAVALVTSVGGAVYATTEAFEPKGSTEVAMQYIDRRIIEYRIRELNYRLSQYHNKAQYVPLTPYDHKQIEWLRFQLEQEMARLRMGG